MDIDNCPILFVIQCNINKKYASSIRPSYFCEALLSNQVKHCMTNLGSNRYNVGFSSSNHLFGILNFKCLYMNNLKLHPMTEVDTEYGRRPP